jgi:hypothetical protein
MDRLSRGLCIALLVWCAGLTIHAYLETRETMRMICHLQRPSATYDDCERFLTSPAGNNLIFLGVTAALGVILVVVAFRGRREAGEQR